MILLIVKYSCLALSICSLIMYFQRTRRLPSGSLVIEQRRVMALSLMLVLFNDPLFLVTILYRNVYVSFFALFMTVTFVAELMHVWLLVLHRIDYENEQKHSNAARASKNQYITFCFWAVAMITYVWHEYQYYSDPSRSMLESNGFPLHKVALFAISLIYFLQLLMHCRSIARVYESKL